ncbi:hypothetical protein Poli38472_011362 [Pythium oligandrum]|uniref:PX domain-containing protein n=1 Tax=Pythium oligandrum TaxID=41045 RepID=A0A8K1CLG6_PYTOL|nr:hypothetical protein Poli38472_011362 [Pythium oligandrum]|eukprot:TMW64482.1 hypothetical protein Poli38472_011362 [Pythium oligandrum]
MYSSYYTPKDAGRQSTVLTDHEALRRDENTHKKLQSDETKLRPIDLETIMSSKAAVKYWYLHRPKTMEYVHKNATKIQSVGRAFAVRQLKKKYGMEYVVALAKADAQKKEAEKLAELSAEEREAAEAANLAYDARVQESRRLRMEQIERERLAEEELRQRLADEKRQRLVLEEERKRKESEEKAAAAALAAAALAAEEEARKKARAEEAARQAEIAKAQAEAAAIKKAEEEEAARLAAIKAAEEEAEAARLAAIQKAEEEEAARLAAIQKGEEEEAARMAAEMEALRIAEEKRRQKAEEKARQEREEAERAHAAAAAAARARVEAEQSEKYEQSLSKDVPVIVRKHGPGRVIAYNKEKETYTVKMEAAMGGLTIDVKSSDVNLDDDRILSPRTKVDTPFGAGEIVGLDPHVGCYAINTEINAPEGEQFLAFVQIGDVTVHVEEPEERAIVENASMPIPDEIGLVAARIVDSRVVNRTGKKFIQYKLEIRTNNYGTVYCWKRYSTFRSLCERLQKEAGYSRKEIPELPKRQITGNFSQHTIGERAEKLNVFLAAAVHAEHLQWGIRVDDQIAVYKRRVKRPASQQQQQTASRETKSRGFFSSRRR